MTSSTQALVPDAYEAVRVLMDHIGLDCDQPGTKGTPRRLSSALKELCTPPPGSEDVATILSVTFGDDDEDERPGLHTGFDEMVVVTDVTFVTLCEHHLLPFWGTAKIGYIPGPDGRVVGLSKLARLLDHYAARPQLQERLTKQVTTALMDHLDVAGAGAIVHGTHSCMALRGPKKPGAAMVTSSLQGVFRTPEVRAEFLAL